MTNEEIVAGLKNALERGQSLKSAMMSFYQAGYDKTEIEEAARALAEFKVEPVISKPEVPLLTDIPQPRAPAITQMPVPAKKVEIPSPVQPKPIVKKEIQEKTIQKVSEYGGKKIRSVGGKLVIIILVLLLFLLVGSLVAIFLFRDQIIGLLNSIF